jgi:hypothetical protein
MTRFLMALLALGGSVLPLSAQNIPPADRLLSRRYVEGEQRRYAMKTQNDGSTYEVLLTATVKKGNDGRFVEEYALSDLVANGGPRPMSPASQAFRLAVTLEGGTPFAMPDLSKVPGLIGPITDVMTFYADLFLAIHSGVLRQPGDRFHVPSPATGSWADGNVVVIGEDAVDFDITLIDVDKSSGVASLLVKHVPPLKPKIRLSAGWMRLPVADTANNYVQVRKTPNGYVASIGKETFDVELRLALTDGKLLSATMDNRVTQVTRECSDASLTQCGETRSSATFRHIEMSLVAR